MVAAAKSSGLSCYSCFSSVVIPHKSVKALLILNKVFNWNIKALGPHFRRFKPCFLAVFQPKLLWSFVEAFYLFLSFQYTQRKKEASLWFGVETAQHKGKSSIPLLIWIPVSLDLLKNQTTLLSFNIFTRKVARCHCWPLPHYLKNATVPRDLLSPWWLCAPFPPFCQFFSLLSFCPEWPELSWFAGWIIVPFQWALLFCPFFSTALALWHFLGRKRGGNERLYLEQFHPGGKYQ